MSELRELCELRDENRKLKQVVTDLRWQSTVLELNRVGFATRRGGQLAYRSSRKPSVRGAIESCT